MGKFLNREIEKEVSMQKFLDNIKKLVENTNKDLVMVYSAQASYFVIISAIPFLCLLISIASFFLPEDIYTYFDNYALPQEIKGFVQEIIAQLLATQKVSLLSVSAVTALWTASRGSDAMRAGLECVYEVPPSKKFFKQQALSLVNTVILIIIIIVNIILVLFGQAIANALHLTKIVDLIMNFSIIILFIIMCLVFAVVYASTAKHSKNEHFRSHIKNHVPGAVFATLGWMLFSFFYSLYIKYFPSASAIYGSLTAVCLIMLWLYVCMIILMLGAEVNKIIIQNKVKEK